MASPSTIAASTASDTDAIDNLARTAEFRMTLRRFLNRTAAVTAGAGLTPQRYDLLLVIKAASLRDEDVTVGSLCTSLDLQQPAVTELVQRAEAVGLVARSRSARDGRVYHLRLTPEGEKRLLRVFKTLTEDRVAITEAFERLGASFDAARPR